MHTNLGDMLFEINEMIIENNRQTNTYVHPVSGQVEIIDVSRLLALWDIIREENYEHKDLVTQKEWEEWENFENEVNSQLIEAADDQDVVRVLDKVVDIVKSKNWEAVGYRSMSGKGDRSTAFHAPESQLTQRIQSTEGSEQ